MRTYLTSFVAVLAAVLLAGSVSAAEEAAIGKAAPGFSLQDQTGKTVNLADYKGKIVVLEWINPECPYVQRHYKSETMETLASDYADKDVVWLAINSTSQTGSEKNAEWVKEHELSYPILNDQKGEVGGAYNAKTTPHMYIIDREGVLRYNGAIDDDPRGSKGDGAKNYVRQALDQVVAGSNVTEPETKPYGCSVKYAK